MDYNKTKNLLEFNTNFKNIKSSFFQNKSPIKKFFTITYGPPGSGKSDLIYEIWNKLKIDITNVIDINVDKIVEQIDGFGTEYANSRDPIMRDNIYFKYRTIADEISEDILIKAVNENYHIVWETTGKSIDWAMKTIHYARSNGYIIFLVYPFVDRKTLLSRNETRAQQFILEGKIPRKPSDDIITSNILLAQINIEKLIPFVDKIAIYDNTKERENLGALWQMEKEYIGYCSKNDKNCQNGIIHKITCSDIRLTNLKDSMDESFYNFLRKECPKPLIDIN